MINQTKPASPAPALTAEQFALLGGGDVAYVREMSSDEVIRLFPQIKGVQPGAKLFALIAADGSPILLTGSKDTALANAWENNLSTVSVH
ncbi:MAG: DUF1150 domain-containing protein [Alphaproteobacteria bacterium]|nr:DUF1150 domain-containing protein [Alphaproteobacteria bacterium]